jgi:hypothetical protein
MPRCMIHVGTHKTGTTTLQAILKERQDELLVAGIHYPLLDGERCQNSIAHKLSICSDRELDDIRRRLIEPFRHQHRAHDCLLLSAEELSTRICVPTPWTGLEHNYPDKRRQYLSKLKKLLINFEKIDLYLCLRDHEEYAHSLYATKILSGQISCSFSTFVSQCFPIFNYKLQAGLFNEIGTLHVKHYEDIKRDLDNEFMLWLQLPVGAPETAPALKKTPPYQYVYWLSQSIQTRISMKERKLRTKFCWHMRDSENTEINQIKLDSLWDSNEDRINFAKFCLDEQGNAYSLNSREVCQSSLEQSVKYIDQCYMQWRTPQKRSFLYFLMPWR